jgi:hypothetical protein
MYGYDSFVLEDNQYGESFYTDMTDSIQMKKIYPPANPAPVPVPAPSKSYFYGGPFMESSSDYINELQKQIYVFYILLVSAIVIIVMQRMTITTLQNFVFSKVLPGVAGL